MRIEPPKECPRCWRAGTMVLLKTHFEAGRYQWGHTCTVCNTTWTVPNALVDYPILRARLVRSTAQARRFINRGIASKAAHIALERDRKAMAAIRTAYGEALSLRSVVAA